MKKNVLKKAIPLTVAATMMNVVPVAAYDKDETVYTKVDGDGNVTYQVVSEQLKSSKKEEIKDHSDLSNIKNISGDEKYKKDGNDLTWKSKGDDIFYQGKTTRQLPITVETSYKLDGQEISPKDASGKKGHVEISFKLTNNDKHDYNGKTLYTPFTIALATTLNSDNNKNVTINNGKVVNNGENNIIVGVAAPGLYESLNIDQLKSFDEIKIEFDTTDLDIKSFYSVATPKLATADDINNMFDKIDGSFDDLNKLKDATNQLVTGTSDLSKGAKTLSDGTKTFNSGLVTANSGAGLLTKNSKSLRDGASQLASGLGTLSNGSGALVDGLKKAASGSDQLTKGLEQAKDGSKLLSTQGTAQLKSKLKKQVLEAAYDSAAYGLQASAGAEYYKEVNPVMNSVPNAIDAIKAAAYATGAYSALQQSIQEANAQKEQAAETAKAEVLAAAKKEGFEQAKQTDAQVAAVLTQLNIKSYDELAAATQNSAITDATVKTILNTLKTGIDSAAQRGSEKAQEVAAQTATSTIDGIIKNINLKISGEENKPGIEAQVKDLTEAANLATSKLTDLQTKNNSEEGKKKATVANFLLSKKEEDLAKLVKEAYEKHQNSSTQISEDASIVYNIMSQNNVFSTIDNSLAKVNGVSSYTDQVTKISDVLNTIYAGSSQLSSGLDTAVNKLPTLTNGISALVSGSSKLNAGTKEYTEGVDKLAGGVSQLTSAFTQIVNGSAQLSTGADKLASGMSEYKTTGIDKLTELADTLNGDSDTAKQLTKYADEYTYTATNKDANYTTKFVYIVQE